MRAFAGPHCPRLESQVCAPGHGHGTTGLGLGRAILDALGLGLKLGSMGFDTRGSAVGNGAIFIRRAGRHAELLWLSPKLAIRTETLQAPLLGSEPPMASAKPKRQTLAQTRALGWDLGCGVGILCTFFPSALRGNLRPLVAVKR